MTETCSYTFIPLQAGKFNMIPTLINMVAAFTSVGVVSWTGYIWHNQQ